MAESPQYQTPAKSGRVLALSAEVRQGEKTSGMEFLAGWFGLVGIGQLRERGGEEENKWP